MKISSLFPVALILLIIACDKEITTYGPHSDDPFYGTSLGATTVLAPCVSPKNTTVVDSDTIHYTTVGNNDPWYDFEADWGVLVYLEQGMPYIQLRAEFSQEPKSGKYITADAGAVLTSDQCIVSGVWYRPNYFTVLHFRADANDTVYVTKGFGKCIVTFCDLHFVAPGNLPDELTASGNITIE